MIRPKSALTPEQQILLRIILNGNVPIITVLHNGRMHEVIHHGAPLREVQPWFESDGTPSDSDLYWIKFHRPGVPMPVKSTHRKPVFSRLSSPPMWMGEPRPKAQRKSLITKFPDAPYLKMLVSKLGYDKRAALAALPQSYSRFWRTDGRYSGTSRQQLVAGQPIHFSADVRDTTVGGGFTEPQVLRGLTKMRTDRTMKQALLDVVYRRQSPQAVADKFGFSRAKLDVYACRLRGHIRRQQHPAPAFVPSRMPVPDLHDGENLAPYLQ